MPLAIMKPIIKDKPLTHNSAFILNYTQERYSTCYFESFLMEPEKYPSIIDACIGLLKERGEWFIRTSGENWKDAMYSQIKEWGKARLLPEQPQPQPQGTTKVMPLPLTPEHKPMQKYSAVPVAQVTVVFGTDVSELSAQACIATIKSNNAQIKDLQETDIESPYITKQIEGLNAANAALVARLDTLA